MERTHKLLQITALVVALLAPPIFFIGYAYDWGYLDSFGLEHQMFSKAPQEYLGYAIVVIFLIAANIFGFVFVENGIITIFVLITVAAIVFTVRSLAHHQRYWSRIYLRWSNWLDRIRQRTNIRLVETVASTYLLTVLPVLILAGVIYLALLVVSPGLMGYGKGQEEAKRIKNKWRPEICLPKNIMAGCTQILEASKVVAQGVLIVASENQVAIFDGSSVQIYSLRNRDIKTVLPH